MQTLTALPKTARQRRRLYHGSLMNFRLLSSETNNTVSVIDTVMVAGTEHQRHLHTNEDETFHIHSGEAHFFIGGNKIIAQAGDVVFAPRGIPHHFKIISNYLRATITITPGYLDRFYWQLSFPYNGNELPLTMQMSAEELENTINPLLESYGVHVV